MNTKRAIARFKGPESPLWPIETMQFEYGDDALPGEITLHFSGDPNPLKILVTVEGDEMEFTPSDPVTDPVKARAIEAMIGMWDVGKPTAMFE